MYNSIVCCCIYFIIYNKYFILLYFILDMYVWILEWIKGKVYIVKNNLLWNLEFLCNIRRILSIIKLIENNWVVVS